MNYSREKTRKGLHLRYLALPISAVIVWLVPFHDVFFHVFPLVFFPLWILLGQILCSFSYVITGLSLKSGLSLFRSSWVVFGRRGSIVHLQAAVLVALIEEVIFRYALLFAIYRFSDSGVLAIVGTSVTFVAMHFRRGFHLTRILIYLDYFVFALVLGAITLQTRSIYPAIILHATRNYILRCLLISKEEYKELHGAA